VRVETPTSTPAYVVVTTNAGKGSRADSVEGFGTVASGGGGIMVITGTVQIP
jgi:hypothetical protein